LKKRFSFHAESFYGAGLIPALNCKFLVEGGLGETHFFLKKWFPPESFFLNTLGATAFEKAVFPQTPFRKTF
jgi:hypothetical protein